MSKMLHTCVRVQNLEESIRFYEEAFGFKETHRKDFPEHKFTIVYLAFEGDDYELELTYNYGHGPYEIGDGYGHIAISAKDLEGLHACKRLRRYRIKRFTRTSCKLLFRKRLRWLQNRSNPRKIVHT